MEREVDLVLDSGAYSCWKRRESLTVQEYISFIRGYDGYLDHVVNLDVIPGQWGRVPSPAQVEESAHQSWKNFLAFRKAGIEVMPVFHQGERRYWLEKMLDSGCEYIGISPANDRTTKQKIVWLDEIFTHLCGSKGFPAVKTHGFGVTALPILFRYPWYSADSVTWLLVGGYGAVLIPKWDQTLGDYSYSESPLVVPVSHNPGKVSAASMEPGKHISTMGEESKAYVLAWLQEQGFELPDLETDYVARQRVNCRYFKLASKLCVPPRWKPRRPQGFFSGAESPCQGREAPLNEHLNFIFTLTTSTSHSDILQDEGVRLRLLTYYYFKSDVPFDLKHYVVHGRIPLGPRSRGRRKTAKRVKIKPRKHAAS